MNTRTVGLLMLTGLLALHWAPIKHRHLFGALFAGGLLVLHRRPIKMLYRDVSKLAASLLEKAESKTASGEPTARRPAGHFSS